MEMQPGIRYELDIKTRCTDSVNIEIQGRQAGLLKGTSDMNPEAKRFRKVIESNPIRTSVVIKAFLGSKEGQALISEALSQAAKDPKFIKSFLDHNEGTQILINSLKRGVNDPKFGERFFKEYDAIICRSKGIPTRTDTTPINIENKVIK
ncbi:MAG: hypothetical protein LBQ98_10860 [Nitrososphaerota archaeon]|jgi:hypothetical protein|nr:hypothetical protein [Nitrososphaerota archaeon]